MGPVRPDDDDLHTGRLLGPYELLAPIGSGGMARVWAARDVGSGVVVALKMLMGHLADNSSFRDMFFDEARIASRVRHENVCATYELVELEGILTLVMEWVDGSSLVHVLRPGPEEQEDHPYVPLPLRHAVKILSETCAGLHAAHDLVDDDGHPLSVVHRDVSPHNVLLTRDGRVKVTDFGVAKALGKLHMTIAGQVKGKLAYMSPEQLAGGGVDRRSDVFSLGSVLYEATTGQRPFQGEHDPQVMAAIIMGNFEPPRSVVQNYPPELEAIVLRAMSTEPEARYSTALQLRQALEGWLASTGPVLGAQQIAVLLQERCGPELAARAESLSLPPLSLPRDPQIESGTSAMEVDRRSQHRPAREHSMSTFWTILSALLGLAAGLCVLFYVREARRVRARAAASAVVEPVPAPSPLPPVAATVTLEAGVMIVGDLDDPPARRGVTLKLPEGARLWVDGQMLPAGTSTITRPDAGTITVTVRADGRFDAPIVVDPSSPDEITVTMVRKKRSPPPPTITTPPNPYE